MTAGTTPTTTRNNVAMATTTSTSACCLVVLLLLMAQQHISVVSTFSIPSILPTTTTTTNTNTFHRIPTTHKAPSSNSQVVRNIRRRTTTAILMTLNSDVSEAFPEEIEENAAAAATAASSIGGNQDINDEEQKSLLPSPFLSATTTSTPSRFLQGDELHRLRRRVLNMKQSLYTARQQQDIQQIQQLTLAILAAQNLDAEYIYTSSLIKQQNAIYTGLYDEAAIYEKEAKMARESLLQFSLSGLWVGKYNDNTFQLINVTYTNDVLTAYKITASSTCNVPKGEVTFQVDLTPPSSFSSPSKQSPFSSSSSMPYTTKHHFSKHYNDYAAHVQDEAEQLPHHHQQYLEPIQLHNEDAIEQWGIQYLQRHVGIGQVATSNYQNPQFIPGQLILINEQYFSFVWMPTQHHVFFGRPSPELILKLLRENENSNNNNSDGDNDESNNNNKGIRQYLERCYEETLLIDDEMEVNDTSLFTSHDQTQYYIQEGCFE